MTSSDRIIVGAGIAATVVGTFVLAAAGQPFWLGSAICVPVFALVLLVRHHWEDSRAAAPVVYQPVPVQPAAVQAPPGTHIRDVALPSAAADYRFLLHGLVRWRAAADAPVTGAERIAVNAVVERAQRITRQEPPEVHDLIAPRLAVELGQPAPDRTGLVEAWLEEVVVTLPDADLQRLRRLADVRKDEQVWEQERQLERNKRRYLRDDVLQSTGSAVVWWLAQDPTRVEQTVSLIGALAKLSAVAQDRPLDPVFEQFEEVPETVEAAVRRLMDEVVPGSAEHVRSDFADRLASLASELGADEVAARIREAFNAPDLLAADLFSPTDVPAAARNGDGPHDEVGEVSG
ncbi:hypothetical protein [Actinokineospora sp. NPDC004072]